MVFFEGNVGGYLLFFKNLEIDEVMEDFEELKVVVEKFFSLEWEDDEWWWEEESFFEISFFVFSSEIVLSSLIVISLGFIKCFDFCFVMEFKKKLEIDVKFKVV